MGGSNVLTGNKNNIDLNAAYLDGPQPVMNLLQQIPIEVHGREKNSVWEISNNCGTGALQIE